MNQRARPPSRRTLSASTPADIMAFRSGTAVPVSAAVIETLLQHDIEAIPIATIDQRREQYIAEAAYLRAEARGFESGHELEDWLAAEKAVDAIFAAE